MPDLLRITFHRGIISAVTATVIGTAAWAQAPPRVSRNSDLNSRSLLPSRDEFLNSAPVRGRDSMLHGDTEADLSKVDLKALSNLLRESIDQSEKLYRLMDSDYQRNPQLRPLLSEIVTLRNRARKISTDLDNRVPLDVVIVDFRSLDRDWRLFSNQVVQARLSEETRATVSRLDRIDQEIGKLFKVAPTLDRRSLLEEMSAMRSAFRALIDELELDPNGGNAIDQMISDSQKLQQQIRRIEEATIDTRVGQDQIVNEYSRFTRLWNSLVTQLQTLENRRLERQLAYIMESDNNIHNLLWLENTSNKAQLQQTAVRLMRTVDEFYNRTPLKLLLNVRDVKSAIQTANDFYGTVQNFKDLVDRNESTTNIVNAYRDVEEYGYTFTRAFDQMNSQTARVVLREIEDGIAALRSELNMAGTVSQVDYRSLEPISASLDNLADQLDYDVRLWLNSDRQTYANEALRASQTLMNRARRLHQLSQRQTALRDLQKETDLLITELDAVKQFLSRCRTTDRSRLASTYLEILRDVEDLRTLLQMI
ncbi:MAG: hypothetical protein ACK526_19875 [Planctomyces sp.]|jgi:hypothetical protein